MTGRQAHKIGLVDQLGGLDLALSVARKKAGLMGQQVELVSLPQATWLYGLFNNILSLDLGVLDLRDFGNSTIKIYKRRAPIVEPKKLVETKVCLVGFKARF